MFILIMASTRNPDSIMDLSTKPGIVFIVPMVQDVMVADLTMITAHKLLSLHGNNLLAYPLGQLQLHP